MMHLKQLFRFLKLQGWVTFVGAAAGIFNGKRSDGFVTFFNTIVKRL